jgi:hypothetical protein
MRVHKHPIPASSQSSLQNHEIPCTCMHNELRQMPLQISFRRKTKQNARGLDASIRLDIKHMYCTQNTNVTCNPRKEKIHQ